MKIRIVIVAGLLLLGACQATGSNEIIISNNKIGVAVVGPMSGKYSLFGDQLLDGVSLAVDDINNKGQLLGRELTVVSMDDECNSDLAKRVAQKIVVAKIPVVIGHFCSAASIAAAPIYEEAGVVMITPSSTNPELTRSGHSKVFRVATPDINQMKVLADYLRNKVGLTDVVIIDDGTPYNRQMVASFQINAGMFGLKVQKVVGVAPGESDFMETFSIPEVAKAQAIFFPGTIEPVGAFVKQYKDAGGAALIASADGIAGQRFIKVAGRHGEDVIFTFAADVRRLKTAIATAGRLERNGEGYRLYAYSALQLWAKAASGAKSLAGNRVAVVLKNSKIDSILGRTGFDGNGDIQPPTTGIFNLKNGQFNQIWTPLRGAEFEK